MDEPSSAFSYLLAPIPAHRDSQKARAAYCFLPAAFCLLLSAYRFLWASMMAVVE